MIYEGWLGTFNKKGELMSVDESEHVAQVQSNLLELDASHPTNKLLPVTVIVGSLLDLVMYIIDEAKIKADDKRIETIAAQARAFGKEMEDGTETN